MPDQHENGQTEVVYEALDALRIGVWRWSPASDIVHYCRVTAELFGVPYEPRSGLPLSRFVAAMHPEDRQRFHDILDKAASEGGQFMAEYRTVPEPGSERWVLDRGEFARDAEGRIVSGWGIIVDMTDRLDEEQLRGNAFFGAGFQALPSVERAVEHALALRELLDGDDFAGSHGSLLRTMMDEILKIMSREIAASLERDVRGDDTSAPKRLH
jgi:PAS domain S-box-containing protein